ncbi:MAG: hypothetical protein JRJ02_03015 [Deltaproteobacteria bacterium]|nr:hypothetical protein [Deltaproteobacteria bacterium]
MAYTPELSMNGSATLRRLSWFQGQPMTKTLEMLVASTAKKSAQDEPGAVCSACKDQSKCLVCAFSPQTRIHD